MRLISFAAALTATLTAIVLVGCGQGKFGANNPTFQAGVFRYPIVAKPTTLDPAKVQDGDTIDVIQQVYEGLVGWDEKNECVPRLAEKWEIKDGGKTYVFHLKHGVKFHNGREMTADDFKWCFERTCDPKLASPTVETYMSDIVGVAERIKPDPKKGPAPTEVTGVKAIDKYTFQVQIREPRAYFISKLTYPCMYVYAKEAVIAPEKEITQLAEMVGTGPFKLEKIELDLQLSLVANSDYHLGAPKLKRIERPVVLDAATRLNMYKAGKIDLVQLERADVKNLKSDSEYSSQLKYYDRASLWYIGINCNKVPALKDARVRRAMAMAIDKNKIVDQVLDGINKRADCIVPPGCFGHRDTVKAIPYDLDGAKKLLAEAGFPGGKGIPHLTMYYREARPDIDIVATNVGAQLKGLGIEVSFQKLEWGAYLAEHNQHKIPFLHMRWAADYLDAENFLSTLLASYGNENKLDYHNAWFDDLCHRADISQDPKERMALYAQAEDMVLADAPFIPIYFQRDAELVSPKVKNLRDALFGHLPHTTTMVE